MLKRYFFSITFISWMVFVTFSSLFSFSNTDSERFITIPHFDKIVHFTFYYMACVLGVFFIRERSRGKVNFIKTLVVTCIAAIVYGIIIEVLQFTITVDRSGDILDALANSLGSLCGALSIKFLFLNKKQLKWKF